MTQWTDPSRTYLIQEIRNRRIIWDKDLGTDASHKMAKQVAFNEVAELMNNAFPSSTKYTGDDIRSQWKNLKDTFVRKLRYINEGKYAYDSQKEPTWKFYRMLSFLDEKKKGDGLISEPNIFDIAALQRDHGLDLVKSELNQQFEHSNQSTASSEDHMLNLFAQTFQTYNKEKTPIPPDAPPSPTLPPVSQPTTPVRETIVASVSTKTDSNKCTPGPCDDEEEPRRKRACNRRLGSTHSQDEFDFFGSWIASQLRRLAEEHSRSASLRLQKRINDTITDAQIELLEGNPS